MENPDLKKEDQQSEASLLEKQKEESGAAKAQDDDSNKIIEKPQEKKRRKGDQFLLKRVDLDSIDLKTLNEEEKADLKLKLEEECMKICNGYAQELAFMHHWEKFEDIKMANDKDLDDLYDENNQKLKSKLKIIAGWLLGYLLAYLTDISWIFLVFWIGSLLPYVYDVILVKEIYDSYIVPDKEAYFTQSYVSFGFKKDKGKGRTREQDKSLYPKAVELYEYYKETLMLIRSLRPSKSSSSKKIKSEEKKQQ